MNNDSDKWTEEERNRVVAVFEWLLNEDRKEDQEVLAEKSPRVN